MHWFRGYELEGDYAVIIGVRGLDISLFAFGNKLGSQICTCSCSRKREGERGTHNSTPMGIEEPSLVEVDLISCEQSVGGVCANGGLQLNM